MIKDGATIMDIAVKMDELILAEWEQENEDKRAKAGRLCVEGK